MPVVDRTHVRISRIGTALAGWVSDHDFGLGANVGIGFAESDGIAVTFRHFAPIESRNARRLSEHRFRFLQAADLKVLPQRNGQRRHEIVDSYLPNVLANVSLQLCPAGLLTDRVPVCRAFYPNDSFYLYKHPHDRCLSATLKHAGRNL